MHGVSVIEGFLAIFALTSTSYLPHPFIDLETMIGAIELNKDVVIYLNISTRPEYSDAGLRLWSVRATFACSYDRLWCSSGLRREKCGSCRLLMHMWLNIGIKGQDFLCPSPKNRRPFSPRLFKTVVETRVLILKSACSTAVYKVRNILIRYVVEYEALSNCWPLGILHCCWCRGEELESY